LIPKGQLDKWDFVLRRLFVKKSTSLKKAIRYAVIIFHLKDLYLNVRNSNLAPGAEDLLQRIEAMQGLDEKQRVNVGHQIRHLTVDEWATVCRAFDEWPFAPEVSG
jgi:transcription factor 1